MFIEFYNAIINTVTIEQIYKSTYRKKFYIDLSRLHDAPKKEEFSTEQERDARYNELKNLLQGKI